MFKHELNQFLDSLKSDGKELVLTYVYQQVAHKPSIDLYYFRPRLEDLFKEGLINSTNSHLDLLEGAALFKDLENWSVNTVHTILEKTFELERNDQLLKVLKKYCFRLSTIKLVDLLKKILIVDQTSLAQEILHIVILDKNHAKSKFR